jgi:hypothetical protein
MSTCEVRQQALTRSKNDDHHQIDDMRITSYAARYYLNPPEMNCQTAYPTDVTTRLQKSGASWMQGIWKTDIESDLRGINRVGGRARCGGEYNPDTNAVNNIAVVNAPDVSVPMNFNRLNNPPCTLRATGVNRWDYPLRNPQETFETPFDTFIPSRLNDKEKCRRH